MSPSKKYIRRSARRDGRFRLYHRHRLADQFGQGGRGRNRWRSNSKTARSSPARSSPISSRTVSIKTDDGRSMLVPMRRVKTVDGEPYGEALRLRPARPAPASRVRRVDYNKIATGPSASTSRCKRSTCGSDSWRRKDLADGIKQSAASGAGQVAEAIPGRCRADPRFVDRRRRAQGDEGRGQLAGRRGVEHREGEPDRRDAEVSPGPGKYPNAFRPHYRLAFVKWHQGRGQMGGNRILAEAESHARRPRCGFSHVCRPS